MSFKTFFGKSYENDNDEKMSRKYGYNYDYLKKVYPNVCKLPEDEVKPMIQSLYSGNSHESLDDVNQRVWDYTKEKEQDWQDKYFQEPKTEQQNLQEDPWKEAKDYIKSEEKRKEWMYLDKNGKVTVCYGNLDETEGETLSHEWYRNDDNQRASDKYVSDIRKEIINKRDKMKNHTAESFKGLNEVHLKPEYCDKLFDEYIRNSDEELRRGFPNYDKMDQNMKNALMETHYTSNVLGKWPRLRKAAEKMDHENTCKELSRDEDGRPDLIARNKWANEQCLKGKYKK